MKERKGREKKEEGRREKRKRGREGRWKKEKKERKRKKRLLPGPSVYYHVTPGGQLSRPTLRFTTFLGSQNRVL